MMFQNFKVKASISYSNNFDSEFFSSSSDENDTIVSIEFPIPLDFRG